MDRIKLVNFGRQVKSDIHLQTVEIQMRRLGDFPCLLCFLLLIGRCPNLPVVPSYPNLSYFYIIIKSYLATKTN